jgi:DNA-entry nuclease
MKKLKISVIALLLSLSLLLTGCEMLDGLLPPEDDGPAESVSLDNIPAFNNKDAYVEINGNVPFFTDEEKSKSKSFETYSELDNLGRCHVAYACIGKDLMPTEDRGSIGSVKPSGWQSVKYDIVDGKYLYNRCHLIGFQLTGENANKSNLITGTRFLNIDGMLVFEDMVADYIKETENHVLYRVTPIYDGYNLVASGVLIEAWSVEDNGDGICFCVYSYNAQPGISIDYSDGDSWLNGETPPPDDDDDKSDVVPDDVVQTGTYILNTSGKKIHKPTCSSVSSMKEENKQEYTGDFQELLDMGYSPCGSCKPEND